MKKFILASASPRRKSLLEKAGYKVSVEHVKVSEIINENLNSYENSRVLAGLKARTFVDASKHLKLKDFLVLSADTIVDLDGVQLGKPKNLLDAGETLLKLSGKTHSVITGVCFYESTSNQYFEFSNSTLVSFKTLSENEISEYLDSGEFSDKAGSYAIQGLGGKFVSSIEGSFSNVVGLPMELVEKVIKEKGWNVPRR